MPWLFNESAALKHKFEGLVVSDVNSGLPGRPIPVKFNIPESEVSKATFPMIVLDFLAAERSVEREQRGRVLLPYAPEGAQKWWTDGATSYSVNDSPYLVESPVPYDLDYQVTVYSRKSSHDLMLTAMLAAPDRIPARFGFLEIPQDGTVRRLEIIGGPEPFHSEDSSGKRLFRQVYRVRISSEYPPTVITSAAQVLSVDFTFQETPSGIPLELGD